VDRAQKELNIEKQIKKIEDTWSVLALVFNPLPDSDVTALTVSALYCILYRSPPNHPAWHFVLAYCQLASL
jgi:hypothetical protein